MNIIEDIKKIIVNLESNEADCDLINKNFDGLQDDIRDYIFLLQNVGHVSPTHSICHLLLEAYRLGLNAYKTNKDVEELKVLFSQSEKK